MHRSPVIALPTGDDPSHPLNLIHLDLVDLPMFALDNQGEVWLPREEINSAIPTRSTSLVDLKPVLFVPSGDQLLELPPGYAAKPLQQVLV